MIARRSMRGIRARLLVGILALAARGQSPVAWGQSPVATARGQSSDILERATFTLVDGLGALADFNLPFSAPILLPSTNGAGALTGPFDVVGLARAVEEGNPGLGGARSGLSGAAADLKTARSKRLPRVGGTVSVTGIANPMDAITYGKGDLGFIDLSSLGGPSFPIPDKDVVFLEAGDPIYWQAKTTVEQPLFTWGKLQAGIDMATAGQEAARLAYEKARRELLIQVGASAESFAILGHLDEVLGLQAAIGDCLVYISEESRKAGFITQAELIQARIDVKAVDLARARISRQRELLLQDLRGLAGYSELSAADLNLAAPSAGRPRLSGTELVETARKGSIDLSLVAALERVREARQRLAAGSRALRPDLGLQLELSYAGSRIPFVQDEWKDKNDWTLNLSIAGTVPLYDGGASKAALEKAGAELDLARSQALTAKAGIDALVRSAILDLDLARVCLEYDILKLEGHRESVKGQRAERDAGSGSEATYLRALLDTLETVADGWTRLAEYRASLWKLEAVLPSP